MVASGATGGGGDGRRAAGGGRGWAAARRGDDAQAPVAVKLGMRASERSRVRKGRGGALASAEPACERSRAAVTEARGRGGVGDGGFVTAARARGRGGVGDGGLVRARVRVRARAHANCAAQRLDIADRGVDGVARAGEAWPRPLHRAAACDHVRARAHAHARTRRRVNHRRVNHRRRVRDSRRARRGASFARLRPLRRRRR